MNVHPSEEGRRQGTGTGYAAVVEYGCTWQAKRVVVWCGCVVQCRPACGAGVRRRTLHCVSGDGDTLPAGECDRSSVPHDVEKCFAPKCPEPTWTVGAWSKVRCDTIRLTCARNPTRGSLILPHGTVRSDSLHDVRQSKVTCTALHRELLI